MATKLIKYWYPWQLTQRHGLVPGLDAAEGEQHGAHLARGMDENDGHENGEIEGEVGARGGGAGGGRGHVVGVVLDTAAVRVL